MNLTRFFLRNRWKLLLSELTSQSEHQETKINTKEHGNEADFLWTNSKVDLVAILSQINETLQIKTKQNEKN